MLIDRLKTSSVLIAIIALLIYLDSRFAASGSEGLFLVPLLLFFALGTSSDICKLLINSGRPVRYRSTLLATGLVTLSACVPLMWPIFGSVYPEDCPVGRLGWITLAAVAAMFWILLGEMRTYGTAKHQPISDSISGTIERTCAGAFVSLYVGLPMALMVSLRSMNGTTHGGTWGLAALLTMIIVTKSTDAGAYFSGKALGGKLLGKTKLIPRLSPGKTREGALGGIIIATIVAFVCLNWLFPWIAGSNPPAANGGSIAVLANPVFGAMLLGPVLAVSGMVGDLAESLIKRDSGAKDSGNWLPGLGGVWDVTDSLIAAIMPAFLCFAAGVGA